MTSPEAVRAAHPNWTIRRDVGQDWTCWTAQRVRVITAPTLGALVARLSQAEGVVVGDPRVIAASQLLAERHQPITMTPGDLRALLDRYQRRLYELLDAVGQDVREAGY